MKSAREFLIEECHNLQSVLEETLRFKYGLEASKDFFEECQARLSFISDELTKVADTDFGSIQSISALLANLSGIIARIERSSIDEHSWPFVQELKRIAVAICTEATLTNPTTPPEIHVLSGGGLDSYAIQPELNRPTGSRKRIHTIVFPRTRKHFVLLHAILGHEIGHAMWRCSSHQRALNKIVDEALFSDSVLADRASTTKWLYSDAAPDNVKLALNRLLVRGIDENNFFQSAASWSAWKEEILCDFIGLLSFGPSFVAAECNLLYSLDPTGMGLGPNHPPVGCRVNYLLQSANILSHDSASFSDDLLNARIQNFWTALNTKRKVDPWFELFTQKQLKDTVDALTSAHP